MLVFFLTGAALVDLSALAGLSAFGLAGAFAAFGFTAAFYNSSNINQRVASRQSN